jgi:hypothetical protein
MYMKLCYIVAVHGAGGLIFNLMFKKIFISSL